jgi:hypothetical protein
MNFPRWPRNLPRPFLNLHKIMHALACHSLKTMDLLTVLSADDADLRRKPMEFQRMAIEPVRCVVVSSSMPICGHLGHLWTTLLVA